MNMVVETTISSAVRSVRTQMVGVEALAEALAGPELSQAFEAAVAAIGSAKGRLIVTGMGKSGLIGRKIAATMASTGTPSLYIHPAEASHGDLGMITSDDMVLALTWSGETTELTDIITYCRRFDVVLAVITSHRNSTAGRAADICLTLPRVPEACPNQLAPTTSTTIQVILGDALAVALVERRGFSASEFRVFHPGGKLGAQLLTVADLMGRGDALPVIGLDASLTDATIEMSRKRYGSTAVVDAEGRLVGAFTDGDLRRSITTGSLDDNIARHMTTRPLAVGSSMLASEALRVMNENAVSLLFVCDDDRLIGAVHVHDVLRAGIA
ncbi:KpsF/GutQ family sugar-phosphate isomerase [Sphingomonas profundi]|uniref:KpsF/GutQ family sugar-phosphate isomerase n=1 Tax=Alterirhizorhabdus profundi TaxID=2681549 RepID=UPI0012E81BAA|nr:KpsF/GutQ family sugar-phosphate isomerase [Sphingomonas profundi]